MSEFGECVVLDRRLARSASLAGSAAERALGNEQPRQRGAACREVALMAQFIAHDRLLDVGASRSRAGATLRGAAAEPDVGRGCPPPACRRHAAGVVACATGAAGGAEPRVERWRGSARGHHHGVRGPLAAGSGLCGAGAHASRPGCVGRGVWRGQLLRSRHRCAARLFGRACAGCRRPSHCHRLRTAAIRCAAWSGVADGAVARRVPVAGPRSAA